MRRTILAAILAWPLLANAASVTATTGWTTKSDSTSLNGGVVTVDSGSNRKFIIFHIDRSVGGYTPPSCTIDSVSPNDTLAFYDDPTGLTIYIWDETSLATIGATGTVGSCSSSNDDIAYLYGTIENTDQADLGSAPTDSEDVGTANPANLTTSSSSGDLIVCGAQEVDETQTLSWDTLSELLDVQVDGTRNGFAAGNGGDGTTSVDITETNTRLVASCQVFPNAATAPTFAVAPSCSPTTNGVSCTYTASATSTNYGVCVNPGDGPPSAAQVKAGNNDGGTAALWAGSDSNTGTSDTINVTGSNKPVKMNCYFVLNNGSGDSSVDSSQSGKLRSARSGFAIQTLASLSASSIFDCATCVNGGSGDAYFNPDVAVGDVIEYENDTDEDADCDVAFDTDGDFEMTPVAAGDCDGSRSFNISFQDVSSATTGLFTAPTTGNFSTDDTITSGNAAPLFVGSALSLLIALDEAMASYDLDARWNDPEGGAVTVTITPSVTGLSIGSGNLTGTPTACGVTNVIERGTDAAGQYTEIAGVIAVGPRMPDLVGLSEAAAIAAIEALCP